MIEDILSIQEKLKEISAVERLSLIEKCCIFWDVSPKAFNCLYEELDKTSADPSGNPTYSMTKLRES
jgi:hypothetical protein|tara:strand:- start:66 stop:266 length:201 start_codon:yes stop_codon:yes gene_type:complete